MLSSIILSMALSVSPATLTDTQSLEVKDTNEKHIGVRIDRKRRDVRIDRKRRDVRIDRKRRDVRIDRKRRDVRI